MRLQNNFARKNRRACPASVLLATLVSASLSAGALAQNAPGNDAGAYPAKPIRIIAPSSVGGGIDVLARLIAPKITESFGKQVVVENRAGAGGMIGYEIAARSLPDGYTLLLVAGGYTLNPSLYAKLQYDTFKDFERISLMSCAPNVLVVHASVPVNSLQELIALAKSKPNQLNYGSAGIGTTSYLSALLLQHMSNTQMTHVAYKGAGDLAAAVVAGQVQVSFSNPNAAITQSKAGRLRALGVSSAKRLAVIPDVPTIAENGLPGYEVNNCFGMVAPGRTPKPIINKLHAEIVRILKIPEMRAQLVNLGYEIIGSTADEFTAFAKADLAKWAKALKAAGIKPE